MNETQKYIHFLNEGLSKIKQNKETLKTLKQLALLDNNNELVKEIEKEIETSISLENKYSTELMLVSMTIGLSKEA